MSATTQLLNHQVLSPTDSVLSAEATPRSSKAYLWMLRGLCFVALGVTGYLALAALSAGEVAGCSGGAIFNCSHVLHSRWSKVAGIPVSVPAFLMYAFLSVALFFCKPIAVRSRRGMAWGVVTLCALAAGMAAVWFISLQVFSIGHLCLYCMTAHACGIALAAAVLWKRPLGTGTTARLASVSVLGVLLLVGTQLAIAPPPTYKIERFDEVAEEKAAEEEMLVTIPVAAGSSTPAGNAEPEVFEPF